MGSTLPIPSNGSEGSTSKKPVRIRKLLKGVGAKIREEWYEELVRDGTSGWIDKNKKAEVLRKIHETDPWYSDQKLSFWIFNRRKQEKKNAGKILAHDTLETTTLNAVAAAEVPILPKAETITTEQPDDTTTGWKTPINDMSPGSLHAPTSLHGSLAEISPGSVVELQKLAAHYGMDAETLIQYHAFRVANSEKRRAAEQSQHLFAAQAEGRDEDVHETHPLSASMSRASSTLRASTPGEPPLSWTGLHDYDEDENGEMGLDKCSGRSTPAMLPSPSDPPQTLDQFIERMRIFEPTLDVAVDLMDR